MAWIRHAALGLAVLAACRTDPPTGATHETKPIARAEPTASARTWTFDAGTAVGTVPSGLRLAETAGNGTPASWATVAADDAPSPPAVFGVTKTENPKTTYNLAIAEGVALADVDVSVMVKAGTGALDRGGGPMFRVRDENNYYVARWNPLEHNVRFYVVVGGVRTALAKAELELDETAWHSLRVVAEGNAMQLFVDDDPVLRAEDPTHTAPGTVGLWTKADAATLFDDLSAAAP